VTLIGGLIRLLIAGMTPRVASSESRPMAVAATPKRDLRIRFVMRSIPGRCLRKQGDRRRLDQMVCIALRPEAEEAGSVPGGAGRHAGHSSPGPEHQTTNLGVRSSNLFGRATPEQKRDPQGAVPPSPSDEDAHRARTALGPLMRISFFETRTSSMSRRRKVVARGSGRLRGGIGALAGVPLQTQPRFGPD
jgi:hypothetical protein